MEKQIAYCGLICTDCTAYIATQNNDDDMRKATAEKWAVEYNYPFKPEDINCVGCIPVDGQHVGRSRRRDRHVFGSREGHQRQRRISNGAGVGRGAGREGPPRAPVVIRLASRNGLARMGSPMALPAADIATVRTRTR